MSDSEPPVEETRLAPVALPVVFRNQPRLTWTDALGQHTRLADGRLILGSSRDSNVVVQEKTVSRVHAELEVRNDGLWVRDLGSRNGTFVDGLQVTGARVPDRGRVRLGSVEIAVDYDPARQRAVEIWPSDSFGRMVGASIRMRELFALLARIAPMDASVLIHGETGTGKELVAQAIHDKSSRADKPFVVVDCAALPENLLDAELFGHSRGAFTGAHNSRLGAIEAAEGGTVFLDEIGELPVPMQPKLLRVLESRMVRRLGETAYRNVDVRFISATHRDLSRMVGAGEFREDLFFRLSVIPVEVPALRERRDDIGRLVDHFLAAAGGVGNADPKLLRELGNRPWRGNVRELRNFVERARVLGSAEALAMASSAEHGSDAAGTSTRPSSPISPAMDATSSGGSVPAFDPMSSKIFEAAYKDFREAWVDAGEKEYVRRLLDRYNRNVALASREAGVDRTYIYRLIRKHEL